MNKTLSINLSGVIFHIDEDAFQKLSGYLSTIKGYFSESEGRDEIMSDIENRIAEMLSARISDRKQVVILSDIAHVIALMGRPEDFAGEKSNTHSPQPPNQNHHTRKNKRVFRDGDNKILGGVCSGIASYFNADPLWLRLALVIALFAFGSGFLLYIVLWIVIPEAKTTAEKLEMKGEDVNFSNIGKKVEEEIHSFSKKAESWGNEVKNNASSTTAKARGFIDQLLQFIGSLLGSGFRIAGKVFGAFIIIIGLLLLIIVSSALFGQTGNISINDDVFSMQQLFGLFFANDSQAFYTGIALFLFIGIPLMMIIYNGVKLLLSIRTKNKYVSRSAGILWLVGLIMIIILGNKIGNQFSEKATNKNKVTLTFPKSNTLYLRVKDVYENDHSNSLIINNKTIFSYNDENINLRYPELTVVKSESDSIELIVKAQSRGKNKKEAIVLAKNISYEFMQTDSLLEFMPYFTIPENDKWRGQNVYVELHLPKGTIIYLSKSMKGIIYDIKNETNTWDGDMIGRRWVMGEEELRCIDCDHLDNIPKTKRRERVIITHEESDDSEDDDSSLK
jgi:phage shock protein PspC (stress-responsive transcriptional regulator)